MKIVRKDLSLKEETTLFDDETEYGVVHIEVDEMEFSIQEKEGSLYINLTCRRGHDQLVISPNAANAITLGGG